MLTGAGSTETVINSSGVLAPGHAYETEQAGAEQPGGGRDQYGGNGQTRGLVFALGSTQIERFLEFGEINHLIGSTDCDYLDGGVTLDIHGIEADQLPRGIPLTLEIGRHERSPFVQIQFRHLALDPDSTGQLAVFVLRLEAVRCLVDSIGVVY